MVQLFKSTQKCIADQAPPLLFLDSGLGEVSELNLYYAKKHPSARVLSSRKHHLVFFFVLLLLHFGWGGGWV